MTDPVNISLNLPIKLPLNNAFLGYCGQIDAALEWELGGIDGYNNRTEELNLDSVNEFTLALKKGDEPERKHVFDYAVELFSDFWAGKNIVEKHFKGVKFYFVVGPQRSGGTYLLTQLYEAVGVDYRTLNRAILRDSIPQSKHLVRGRIQASEELQAIFELCQFLAWAKEVITSSVIIQKNTAYAHWIPTLDKIFGNQAHYIVTARRPLACVASFIQLGLGFDNWEALMASRPSEIAIPPETDRLRHIYNSIMTVNEDPTVPDILLANWRVHYTDLVSFRPRGEITVAQYGSSMLDFFDAYHPAYLKNHPRGLDWAIDKRDYCAFAEKFDIDLRTARGAAEEVHLDWATKGLEFPIFEQD